MNCLAGRWYRVRIGKGIDDDKVLKNFKFAGTYVIFADNKPVYIGESINLFHRIKQHFKPARYSHAWETRWGCFSCFFVAIRKERKPFERMMIESRFIHKLKPLFNKNDGKYHHSGDKNGRKSCVSLLLRGLA